MLHRTLGFSRCSVSRRCTRPIGRFLPLLTFAAGLTARGFFLAPAAQGGAGGRRIARASLQRARGLQASPSRSSPKIYPTGLRRALASAHPHAGDFEELRKLWKCGNGTGAAGAASEAQTPLRLSKVNALVAARRLERARRAHRRRDRSERRLHVCGALNPQGPGFFSEESMRAEPAEADPGLRRARLRRRRLEVREPPMPLRDNHSATGRVRRAALVGDNQRKT